MKLIITERQLKFIVEQYTPELDLNRPIDLSKLTNIEDIKSATKSIGLSTGYGSKSRTNIKNLKPILDIIDSIEDRDIFEKYLLIILDLINRYKKKHYTLKKFNTIIAQIVNLDINIAKDQIKTIIGIFEDHRFKENEKEKLINKLTDQNLTLEEFFKETKKISQEYENSFSEVGLSPFTKFNTSPWVSIKMKKGYDGYYVYIDPKEFNSKNSDLEKMLYIINSLKNFKSFNKNLNMDDTISKIMSELDFDVSFDYSSENVKADLKLKEPIFYYDYGSVIRKPIPLAKTNSFIEVKYKSYDEPSYLSEFFKFDASTQNIAKLLEETSTIPNISDPKKTLKLIISKIVNRLYNAVISGQGKKIIDHLTKDLAGMIFKDEKFVKKENIDFYWNQLGYANKPRLSIWYRVKDLKDVFYLSKIESENGVKSYTRFFHKKGVGG